MHFITPDDGQLCLKVFLVNSASKSLLQVFKIFDGIYQRLRSLLPRPNLEASHWEAQELLNLLQFGVGGIRQVFIGNIEDGMLAEISIAPFLPTA